MSKAYSLESDGFTVIRAGLSEQACIELEGALARLPMQTREKWGLKFVNDCIRREPIIGQLLQALPHLSELGMHVESVLHDEVVELNDKCRDRNPWHQDSAYFPTATISVVIALTSSDSGRGGISVVPASHLAGSKKHRDTDIGLEIDACDVGQSTTLSLKRGDVALIAPNLVHVGLANRTSEVSRSYSIVLG